MNQKHSFREYSNYKVPRQFKINNSIDIGNPLPLPYTIRSEDIERENNNENGDEIKNENDDKFIKKENVEIFDRRKIKFDINKLIKNLESKEKQKSSEDMKLKDTNTSSDSNINDKVNIISNKTKRKLLIEIGDPLPLDYNNINNSSNSNTKNDPEKERLGMEIKSIRGNLLKSQSLNHDKSKVKRQQLDFGDPLPLEYIGQQTNSEGYRLKVFKDMAESTDAIKEIKEGSNEEKDIQFGLQEMERVESYNSNNQVTEDINEEVKEKNPIIDIVYMDKLISRVLHILIVTFVLFILLSVVSYYLAD